MRSKIDSTPKLGSVRRQIGARVAILALIALASCAAPTETKTTSEATMTLASDERLVVYPPNQCLSDALLERLASQSQLMPISNFKDAMFPWFESGRVIDDPSALDELLAKPHVRDRIDELRVRYVVSVANAKTQSDEFPGFWCGGGYGGAGCLGLGWENKETSLNAVIWDLQKGGHVGAFATETSGTSLSIGVIVPIIFIAYTEEEACEEMANAIVKELNSSE